MGILIRRESPAEYFREMVEAAIEHQGLETGELTPYYLVNLLAQFAFGERPDVGARDVPLGVQFLAALERGGTGKASRLRTVGDHSLFISGFFSDSLKRTPADVDYYVELGARAYLSLSQETATSFADLFQELGERFVAFVDVLNEVSERSALSSNNDLLRLYEKWLRTGSRRDGDRLVERGIVPNASIGNKFVQ